MQISVKYTSSIYIYGKTFLLENSSENHENGKIDIYYVWKTGLQWNASFIYVYGKTFLFQESSENRENGKIDIYYVWKTGHATYLHILQQHKHRGIEAQWRNEIALQTGFQEFLKCAKQAMHHTFKNLKSMKIEGLKSCQGEEE